MQARARQTREKILAAAEEVFAEAGYSGATVDAVAGRAGVNKQRLYAYFGSKRKLFTVVLREAFLRGGLLSEKRLRRIEAEPRRMTEHLLAGFAAIHREHPRFWRLLAWANLEADVDLAGLDRIRRDEDGRLRRVFEAERAAGRMAPVSFATYRMALLATVFFRHANRATLRHTLGVDAARDRRVATELVRLFQPPRPPGHARRGAMDARRTARPETKAEPVARGKRRVTPK